MSFTREHWERQAQRRIGLVPGQSLDTWDLLKRNLRITEAYAEMYLRNPDVYKWAGMAALTSATVGRGMYLMLAAKYSRMGFAVGLLPGEVDEIFERLGAGNGLVFSDIYWQHLAYERAGLLELESIFHAGQLDRRAYRGWRLIDRGRRTGDRDLVWEGNTVLLKFEQQYVLQPGVYDHNPALWKTIAGWIPSPMPGQPETFEVFSARGNIGIFEERWSWIEERMLPHWVELNERQAERVSRRLLRFVDIGTSLSLLLGRRPPIGVGLAPWLRLARSVTAVI